MSLLDLPDDVMLIVKRHLDLHDLLRLHCVAKGFVKYSASDRDVDIKIKTILEVSEENIHLLTRAINKFPYAKFYVTCNRNITEVTLLSGVYSLNLSHCTGVTDVSALGGVRELNISCTSVTDISALSTCHSLDLSYCGGVTDVRVLSKSITFHQCSCSLKNIPETSVY